MHAFHFAVSTAAVAAFGAIVAGQAYPEMTAPAILPISDNQTWMYTTPLNPEDPDYIDDAIAARLAKRSPPAGVYLCDSTNWAGKCKWTPVTPYTCYGYPNSPASSVGPPQGWQCKVFYGKTGCVPGTGTDGKLTYPGAGNLGALYPKADPPKSYLCRPCIDADPHSPCLNNNAPDFYYAMVKYGYGGDNSTCTSWNTNIGTTTKYPCLPTASVKAEFAK